MEIRLNFNGLKMTIENYRTAPRARIARRTENSSLKEYVEHNDFERVFNMPVRSNLKEDVEDRLIDLKDGNVVEKFVLPSYYSIDDAQEYNEFLASAFDEIRGNEGYKLMEIRKSKYQKTVITITKS